MRILSALPRTGDLEPRRRLLQVLAAPLGHTGGKLVAGGACGRGGLGGARPGSDAVPVHTSRSGFRSPLVTSAATEERDGEVWSPEKSKADSSIHETMTPAGVVSYL